MQNNNMGSRDAQQNGAMSGIEKLEAAIAERQQVFHYDDLQAFTEIGVRNSDMTRCIRDDNGKIDVRATFMRAGKRAAGTKILSEVF